MICEKHKVETAVSCGRCEAPVCPKCMVHSDVGVRCKKCAPHTGAGLPSRGKSLMAGGVLLLVGLLVVGALGSGALGGENDSDPYGYDYDYEWEYDVQVNEVVDPWTDGDASAGYRLVAVDVTVSAGAGNDAPYWTGTYDFKLTDTDSFAYGPVASGAVPLFPSDVSLEPGEKVRGWVTFEVDAGHDLKTLTSYEKVIPLGESVSAP